MIVVTTDQIEGKRIIEIANSVESIGLEAVKLEPISEGEISRGIEVALQKALINLSNEVNTLRANAVVGVRLQVLETLHVLEILDSGPHPKIKMITGGNIQVIARGIAVIVQDDNDTETHNATYLDTIVSGISSVLYGSNSERTKIYGEATRELQRLSTGATITDVQEATCNLDILLKQPSGELFGRRVFSVLLYGTAVVEREAST